MSLLVVWVLFECEPPELPENDSLPSRVMHCVCTLCTCRLKHKTTHAGEAQWAQGLNNSFEKKIKRDKKNLLLLQQQQQQQQIVQISLLCKQIQPQGRQDCADTKAFLFFMSISRLSLSIEIAVDWGNLPNTFNSPIVKRELNFECGSDETMCLCWLEETMGVFYPPGHSGSGSAAVTRQPHLADCWGRRESIVTNELFRHLGRD